MNNVTHNIFVYGTLKCNEPNHHWLTNPENGTMKFLSQGRTKEKYPLIIATKYNLPFLLYCPGKGHNIEGEVYKVDDKMLCQLDILEDHPKYYTREITEVVIQESSKSEIIKCWLYFLKDFKPELLSMPFLSCYSNAGPHGRRYMRSEDESTRDDIDNCDLDDMK